MECKHCISLITPFFFLTAFYSASLKAHARTKCCSDTSKVMEFSEQKAFYTPNGMQRSLVNFQPLGPLRRAKGVRAAGCFMEPGAVCRLTRASGFGWESHMGTRGSCAGDACGTSRHRGSSKNLLDGHADWSSTGTWKSITFQLVIKSPSCAHSAYVSHALRITDDDLRTA